MTRMLISGSFLCTCPYCICVPPLPTRGLKVLSICSTCCLSLNFQHSCIHATVRALATQVFSWLACSQSVHVGCSHLAPVRASLRSSYAWPSALPVNPQLCSITYAPRFWASDVHAVPLACMCPASCTTSNASMWHPPVCLPAWLLHTSTALRMSVGWGPEAPVLGPVQPSWSPCTSNLHVSCWAL